MTIFIFSLILLTGCLDYSGFSGVTIIAGIAIDESESNPDEITMTFEIVDTRFSSESPKKTYMVESTGRTVNEAVKQLSDKMRAQLSFKHTEVLIIHSKVAEKRGLNDLLDSFLRDSGTRDSLIVLISRDETAKTIFTPPNEEETVNISFEIADALMGNKNKSYDAQIYRLYNVYDILISRTTDLTLPAARYSQDENKTLEIDSTAYFQGDKLAGYIDSDLMLYCRYAMTNIKNTGYELFINKSNDPRNNVYVSYNVNNSKPKISYAYVDGVMDFTITIDINLSAVGFSANWKALDYNTIEKLQELTALHLSHDIERAINYTRLELDTDLVGFSEVMHNKDHKLWQEIEEDWPEILRKARIKVKCNPTINDTGLIREYIKG